MPDAPFPSGTEPQAPARDPETARLLRAGDPEGLRRLVDDHGARVRGTLIMDFKKVLDHEEIDDALSQATLRVWKARERVDLDRGTLRAWLYAIARNCALRIIEGKRRPDVPRTVDDIDSLGPGAVATATRGRTASRIAELLRRCIERLPTLQRQVTLADLAAGGVADTEMLVEQFGTTANSIYVARTNARKALRTAMQALGYPPTGGAGLCMEELS